MKIYIRNRENNQKPLEEEQNNTVTNNSGEVKGFKKYIIILGVVLMVEIAVIAILLHN